MKITFALLGGLFIPLVAAAQPTRINDLTAVATNGGVVLTWTAPTPSGANALTSSDVRCDVNPINTFNWSSKPNLPWLTNPGTPGTIQIATITGLAPNTVYYIAVKTQDSSGLWSIMSVVAVVTTGDSTYSIRLSWMPSPDPSVAGYKIYYGTASQAYSTNIYVGNTSSCTLPNFSWGVMYYFAATALDTIGNESAFSNEASYQHP